MRRIRNILIGLLGCFVLIGAGLWLFGPYEDATLTPHDITVAPDLEAYFAQSEAQFDDITPGVEKRVVWAFERNLQTEWAILYVHGFSATSEEIRPVPDMLANALGANLIYTRLQGHGRSGDAMVDATVQGWATDLEEGLQAARIAGRKVLVMSTSTGGTLVAAKANDAKMMRNVAGLIFISPNFGINTPVARLLGWPAARYWLPVLAGRRRSFGAGSADHAKYWTTSYPSVAVLPMVALIDAAVQQDPAQQTLPALFWFSKEDKVVRPDVTADIAATWGGPSTVVNPIMGPGDDPSSHVVAGDILSPGQTENAFQGMLAWVHGLHKP